jgi:3-hydroxybutyryl-CoA dehydratase
MPESELPLSIPLSELNEGREARYRYEITKTLVATFLQAFEDRSPIHVDDAFARERGLDSRVSHGAILNGFLSHFVGMRFPGSTALLLSADLRYRAPCFAGDAVELHGRVVQRSESARTVLLAVSFQNLTRDRAAATGKVLVRVQE